MPTTFKRGFNRYGGKPAWRTQGPARTYSRLGAARRIQQVWRHRQFQRSVKKTIRSTIPTDYWQESYSLAPSSATLPLHNVMVLPYATQPPVPFTAFRSGDKVFWKGLTIKWSIHNQRAYAPGNTPGKVRFGLLEARGTQLLSDIILYNPQNVAGGVNDTDAIFNHAKVKVIFDRTVTLGDSDAYAQQGYRDHINVKTFTKCNQRRMFLSNDVTTPERCTQRNWYTFAIASGFQNGQIRVSVDSSFSFKDMS